jgi:hypothetical protein
VAIYSIAGEKSSLSCPPFGGVYLEAAEGLRTGFSGHPVWWTPVFTDWLDSRFRGNDESLPPLAKNLPLKAPPLPVSVSHLCLFSAEDLAATQDQGRKEAPGLPQESKKLLIAA